MPKRLGFKAMLDVRPTCLRVQPDLKDRHGQADASPRPAVRKEKVLRPSLAYTGRQSSCATSDLVSVAELCYRPLGGPKIEQLNCSGLPETARACSFGPQAQPTPRVTSQ